METINRKKVKANKDHECNYCFLIIKKGHHYDHSTHVFDGRIYNWKNHFHCDQIAHKLKMWEGVDEGLTAEDFQETIRCEYQNLTTEWKGGKDFKYPPFKLQLEFVLKHYNLI